jgi:hypothetical protein
MSHLIVYHVQWLHICTVFRRHLAFDLSSLCLIFSLCSALCCIRDLYLLHAGQILNTGLFLYP